ncbi:MAG: putative quinol monooxygenase [Pseudomonadota bacterium]
MIGLVVTLEVQDGKQSEFEDVFKDLMAQVKANEPGCVWYQLFKSKKSETTYTVLEQYASQDALDAHGKTDYFLAAQPKLGACLGGAPSMEVLDIVE